jgi:hypothetical protein
MLQTGNSLLEYELVVQAFSKWFCVSAACRRFLCLINLGTVNDQGQQCTGPHRTIRESRINLSIFCQSKPSFLPLMASQSSMTAFHVGVSRRVFGTVPATASSGLNMTPRKRQAADPASTH